MGGKSFVEDWWDIREMNQGSCGVFLLRLGSWCLAAKRLKHSVTSEASFIRRAGDEGTVEIENQVGEHTPSTDLEEQVIYTLSVGAAAVGR